MADRAGDGAKCIQDVSGRAAGREAYLDFLRVAATCAVVLLHTVTGVTDTRDMSPYPMERTLFLALVDGTTWCVPVFLMISGHLFLMPQRPLSWRILAGKYCRRILFALFLFGVPYALLELILRNGAFAWRMIGESVWRVCTGRSWSHLWYLYLIVLLYLLTPLLRRMLRCAPKGSVAFLLAALAIGSSILPFLQKLRGDSAGAFLPALPDEGIYLFYYLMGYFVGREDCVLEKTGRRWAGAGIVVLLSGMALNRVMGSCKVQMAYNYPFTVLLSILLVCYVRSAFAAMRKEPGGQDKKRSTLAVRERTQSTLEKLVELSFAVYLIHPLFLNLFYKAWDVTPLQFWIGISLPLFYGVVLGLSVLGAGILRAVPFLKDAVL